MSARCQRRRFAAILLVSKVSHYRDVSGRYRELKQPIRSVIRADCRTKCRRNWTSVRDIMYVIILCYYNNICRQNNHIIILTRKKCLVIIYMGVGTKCFISIRKPVVRLISTSYNIIWLIMVRWFYLQTRGWLLRSYLFPIIYLRLVRIFTFSVW